MLIKDIYGKECRITKPYKYTIDWEKDSISKFQTRVKFFLAKYWKSCIVFEEFRVPRTRLSVDLFNYTDKIVVEVQGQQHLSYSKFFHGETKHKFLQQLKRDEDKRRFCDANGFKLVEVYPNDKINKELFERQDVIL